MAYRSVEWIRLT